MKVLVLSPNPYNTAPGDRYRIEQWARYLERKGIEFTFLPFMDHRLRQVLYRPGHTLQKVFLIAAAQLRRFQHIRNARDYDVVFLLRAASLVGPPILERILAKGPVPFIYDFDDAIWMTHVSEVNKRWDFLKCSGKTAAICGLSAHITVGNEYLANFARQYNQKVSIIPTTIDTEVYTLASGNERLSPRLPVIGWTGSHTTISCLKVAHAALGALRQRHSFRMVVIGASGFHLDGVDTETVPWRTVSEVHDLRQLDIGIMPLPDEDFMLGKCGFKLLAYMALGIPAVASPIGVNAEIIEDGVNGFLARTNSEWVEKLSLLINDPALRCQMGRAGRRTIEERYSAADWAPRFQELLHNVASCGRS